MPQKGISRRAADKFRYWEKKQKKKLEEKFILPEFGNSEIREGSSRSRSRSRSQSQSQSQSDPQESKPSVDKSPQKYKSGFTLIQFNLV